MRRASIDLRQAIESFLTAQGAAGKSRATLLNYRADLACLQRKLGDRIAPARLDTAMHSHLRSLRLAHRSWNRHLSTLRSFCDHLVRSRELAANPLSMTAQLRVEWEAPQSEHAEAARNILERIKRPRDRALVALLWDCGMRIGEALQLRWSDVDVASGTVRVRGMHGERSLRLPPRARRVLCAHLADQGNAQSRYVFLANGGRPLSYAAAHRLFRQYAADSGMTMRRLRASAAAAAFGAGASLEDVRNMLGHVHAENSARYHYDGVRRRARPQLGKAGGRAAAQE